jgi:hypothetical protein
LAPTIHPPGRVAVPHDDKLTTAIFPRRCPNAPHQWIWVRFLLPGLPLDLLASLLLTLPPLDLMLCPANARAFRDTSK